MSGELGQSKKQLKKQIEDLERIQRIGNPKAREIVVDVLFNQYYTTPSKEKVISITRNQLNKNLSIINKQENEDLKDEKFNEYYGTDDTSLDIQNIPIDVKKSNKLIKEIEEQMGEFEEAGYLQQEKYPNKKIIVNSLFLRKISNKDVVDEKNLMKYIESLSLSDLEFVFKQTSKIEEKINPDPISIIDFDKHLRKIFDIDKAKLFMPDYCNASLIEAWDCTIGQSKSIIKDFKNSPEFKKKKHKKGQKDYLALTVLYHTIRRINMESLSDKYYYELGKFIDKDIKQKTKEEINDFDIKFIRKNIHYFIFQNNFIETYDIKEKTFYRRTKDYKALRKSFINKGKEVNVPRMIKSIYPKQPFGLFENEL